MFAVRYKDTDPNITLNDGDSSWGSQMILENGFDCGYAANYGDPNLIDYHLFETIPKTDFRRKCWVDFKARQSVERRCHRLAQGTEQLS